MTSPWLRFSLTPRKPKWHLMNRVRMTTVEVFRPGTNLAVGGVVSEKYQPTAATTAAPL